MIHKSSSRICLQTIFNKQQKSPDLQWMRKLPHSLTRMTTQTSLALKRCGFKSGAEVSLTVFTERPIMALFICCNLSRLVLRYTRLVTISPVVRWLNRTIISICHLLLCKKIIAFSNPISESHRSTVIQFTNLLQICMKKPIYGRSATLHSGKLKPLTSY